ncbi:hypothetical protein CHS0354_037673 [Potamilus streckersoni]|uniref:Uncharacterized protein n=1 Tax=Potamilus streckersoni TaxID=2493646 RepID=A0AAE0T051_9BIVA|nr:hypothetical protein CHS0354_037673 [Potamilus streckersoni]
MKATLLGRILLYEAVSKLMQMYRSILMTAIVHTMPKAERHSMKARMRQINSPSVHVSVILTTAINGLPRVYITSASARSLVFDDFENNYEVPRQGYEEECDKKNCLDIRYTTPRSVELAKYVKKVVLPQP